MAAEKINDILTNLEKSLPVEATGKVNLKVCLDFEKANKDTIIICEGMAPDKLLYLVLNSDCHHIVNKDAQCVENELQSSAEMILNPKKFLENPMETIFNPFSDTKNYSIIYDRKFRHLDEKYEILEEAEASISQYCKSSSFIYDVQSIADELVTNAIFHSRDIEKRENFLDGTQFGHLQLAINDQLLSICCRDNHGRLDTNKLFQRIYKCYNSQMAETINMGKGGAGIGSYMVHSMSTSYFVGVESGKTTVICSVLPLNMSNRKRLRLPRNLHYVNIKGDSNG